VLQEYTSLPFCFSLIFLFVMAFLWLLWSQRMPCGRPANETDSQDRYYNNEDASWGRRDVYFPFWSDEAKKMNSVIWNDAVFVMGMAICSLVTEVVQLCNPAPLFRKIPFQFRPWLNSNLTPRVQRNSQNSPWFLNYSILSLIEFSTFNCFKIIPCKIN
jgi:hypothetical protein